ncbi:MAG: relaxase/mobilization nuclease domain-containing protein [Hyphomicrobiales bacterium]
MKSENERIEVHEVRGFVASDLLGAFRESYAVSRSTQCKQHLYSLSLSPPKGESVSNAVFEKAIREAEVRLGLSGQPRTVVFHAKRGDDGKLRRHAHAVWCRIDINQMKAVQLSFSHRRLQSLARELYLEHGWQMPRGLLQQGFCDPRNFTLEEWQQAKRRKKDPRVLKAMFQEAWAMSDSRDAFANSLLEKGFALARGNRRGFAAVDHTGEVYSLSRWTGEKPKDLRTRLGDERQLQSVNDAQCQIADMAVSRLDKLRDQLSVKRQAAFVEWSAALAKLTKDKDEQLEALEQHQKLSLEALAEHASRFRTGLFGLLDRLSGRRKRMVEENRLERERLRRQHDKERTHLHLALDQKRTSLERIADKELRSREALSTIARDIEALHVWRMVAGRYPKPDRRRKRERLARE